MFSGFNDSTIKYFVLIECQNDKYTFKNNHTLYEEGIKQPCEHLFDELASFLTCLDNNLILNKRICISSPYNDARFCAGTPMSSTFISSLKHITQDQKTYLDSFLMLQENAINTE